MAGSGTAKIVPGHQDTFGGHSFGVVDYTGVASYVNGTGELLSPNAFGFFNYILAPIGTSITISGTYRVEVQPVNTGVTKWYARWFVLSTGLEVANATNLSAQIVKLTAIGF